MRNSTSMLRTRGTCLPMRKGCMLKIQRSSSSLRAGEGQYSSFERDRKLNERTEVLQREIQERMQTLTDDLRKSSKQRNVDFRLQQGPEAKLLKEKIQIAITAMQEGLVERDTEVRLLLLAALSGEHILFIGPPGTAKSEIGRRLNKMIQGTYFERLLTRFSVPEELFGPLSMRALEEDRYVRQTLGYLPDAEVAFVDEIFKANSAILNTLLTVMNERLFDNGSQRVPVPLLTMVGASNELPESEELDALYDRFLVRRQVSQVSASGVAAMVEYYTTEAQDSSSTAISSLSRSEIAEVKSSALRCVRVPSAVVSLVTDLRTYLQEKSEPPVYVSDRRLVKAIQMLQVAAYCNGRDSVTEYDCLLLQHIMWQKPEQSERIADWILKHLSVDDGLAQINFLLAGLFSRACRSLGDPKITVTISAELEQLKEVLKEKYAQVAGSLEDGFPVVKDNVWFSLDDSEALVTSLEPKLTKARDAVKEVLGDVVTLEVALHYRSEAVTLASVMPKHWASFIRNSDTDEVKPIGTRPLPGRSSMRLP